MGINLKRGKEIVTYKNFGNRAELGVDGDHAFALLGPNLQEGEAEFEKIIADPDDPIAWSRASKRAASMAFRQLEKRLGIPLGYYIGPSHPSHC